MDASGGRASNGRCPATDGAAIAFRALQGALLAAGRDKTAAAAASGFISPGISHGQDFSSSPDPAGETKPLAGDGGYPRAAPAPSAPHAAAAPSPATPQRNCLSPSAEVWRSQVGEQGGRGTTTDASRRAGGAQGRAGVCRWGETRTRGTAAGHGREARTISTMP